MTWQTRWSALLAALVLLFSGCSDSSNPLGEDSALSQDRAAFGKGYSVVIDPDDFVAGIDNPYLAFAPGRTFYYESETEDGLETIVVEVTHDTRIVMGVTATIVHDEVFLDGDLIEDTYDWYAQDKWGNVWYFGEDSKEIEDGQVVGTEGSWEAGVDGALPGILMHGNPVMGKQYYQEYYEGEAEDMAKVVSMAKPAEVPYGGYSNCLKTMEWTHLDPGHREFKFYAPGVGVVLEVGRREGGQRVELIDITN